MILRLLGTTNEQIRVYSYIFCLRYLAHIFPKKLTKLRLLLPCGPILDINEADDDDPVHGNGGD